MHCPFCGAEMEYGFLYASQGFSVASRRSQTDKIHTRFSF